MSKPIRLIDLLTTWLNEQCSPYRWEKYSTYVEGYIFNPKSRSWFSKSDITIWVQDPPYTELIEVEWWLDNWKSEKFKIIDPDLFIKLKNTISTIMSFHPGIIRPLR